MIGYFMKIRLQYYLGGLAGALVIFLLFATTSHMVNGQAVVVPLLPFGLYFGEGAFLNILPLLVMVVWVFGWRYVCGAKAKKKLYAILDILLNECQPQRFVAALRPLLPKNASRKKRFIYLRLLLCTGLIEAGEFGEAKEILDSFTAFPKGNAGAGYKFTFYNNRFRYYYQMGQLEDCSDTLVRMKELLKQSNYSVQMYRIYDSAYDQKKALYRMESGDYTEAEEVFARMAANARHEIDRINARLVLGRVALHQGRNNDARRDFEYVVEKGGKTIEALAAAEWLKNIPMNALEKAQPTTAE